MINCCNHTKKHKKCLRKKDNKIFNLPRKYSKKNCKNPKGFTKKSSCAPYKFCKMKGGKLSFKKNIRNTKLKICSKNPITGFYRNGYCMTGPQDLGTHTVCSLLNKKFMDYTRKRGNNLYTVAKPGDKWCLCEYRWNQAYFDGFAPKVIIQSTNKRTKKHIQKNIIKHSKNLK